jgi:ATP-dependent DNA ligase
MSDVMRELRRRVSADRSLVSKRLGTPYRAGRSAHWLKIKNPGAPAVRRLEEEDWT